MFHHSLQHNQAYITSTQLHSELQVLHLHVPSLLATKDTTSPQSPYPPNQNHGHRTPARSPPAYARSRQSCPTRSTQARSCIIKNTTKPRSNRSCLHRGFLRPLAATPRIRRHGPHLLPAEHARSRESAKSRPAGRGQRGPAKQPSQLPGLVVKYGGITGGNIIN